MNLEQIVKETVAKIVAEKKGKDLTGDGKIDSKDYLKARSMAIEKAKGLDEDYEVAMAQDSLDSIIRAAMMLKAQMGDNEVNLPAWIQDHITNSENYIYQAAKGYHESSAQTGAEDQSMDEANEAFQPKSSFDDYSIGDNVTVNGKKAKITSMEMDDETGERRARVRFEDDSVEKISINSLDEAQDISDNELAQLQATADDTSKMPAERDAARNKIYSLRAKKELQELDEWTVSRWQHYAGIK